MTHTPTPWIANHQHSGVSSWRIETDEYTNDGWSIAELHGPDSEADAAFIVEACNNYEALKASHTELLKRINNYLVYVQAYANDGSLSMNAALGNAEKLLDEAIANAAKAPAITNEWMFWQESPPLLSPSDEIEIKHGKDGEIERRTIQSISPFFNICGCYWRRVDPKCKAQP